MIYKSKTNEYKVIKQLGEGESGITYLVESNNKQFVLKELKISNIERWSIVERFKKEIEILKTINHYGIPKFIDIIEDSNTIAYIQEYIKGKTFKEMIENNDKISDQDFKSYFLQALNILNYLHKMIPPIIHQDISPKNIIINEDKLYLIDFGAVKTAIQGEKSQTLTTVGTLGYMAPEQLMGKAVISSDIYSLGMTFLAIKNNKKASDFEMNQNTGELEINNLIKIIPSSFKDVIKKTISPTLKRRFQSIDEITDFIKNQETRAQNIKPQQKKLRKRYLIPFVLLFLITFSLIKSTIPYQNETSRYGSLFTGHGNVINIILEELFNRGYLFGGEYIYDIKISPNKKYMASISTKSFILWDFKKATEIFKLKGNYGYNIDFGYNSEYIYLMNKNNVYSELKIKDKKIVDYIDIIDILLKADETINIQKVKCTNIATKYREIICTNEHPQKRTITIYLVNLTDKKAQDIGTVSGGFSSKVSYIQNNDIFIIPIYIGDSKYKFKYYYYDLNEKTLKIFPNNKEINSFSLNSNIISIEKEGAPSIYTISNQNKIEFRCSMKKTGTNKSYISNDGKLFASWSDYARIGGDINVYNTENCKLIKSFKRISNSISRVRIVDNNLLLSDENKKIISLKIK